MSILHVGDDALLLSYQVEFSLLQAGHYGAPQTRIRFFLIAAKVTAALFSEL